MIARYTKDRGYSGEGRDPSLTLGNEYLILMVSTRRSSDGNDVMLGVLRDSDQQQIMVSASFFTVIDSRIPPNWLYELNDNAVQAIYPKEFEGAFLENLADGKELEERIFSEVVKGIQSFHYSEAVEVAE